MQKVESVTTEKLSGESMKAPPLPSAGNGTPVVNSNNATSVAVSSTRGKRGGKGGLGRGGQGNSGSVRGGMNGGRGGQNGGRYPRNQNNNGGSIQSERKWEDNPQGNNQHKMSEVDLHSLGNIRIKLK